MGQLALSNHNARAKVKLFVSKRSRIDFSGMAARWQGDVLGKGPSGTSQWPSNPGPGLRT